MTWPHKKREMLVHLALVILQRAQWKRSTGEVLGKHYMQAPDPIGPCVVRIYTRSAQSSPQFWYGIRRDYLANTDRNIFFAEKQPYILAVRSQFLLDAYNAMRSPTIIDEPSKRWSVNIYFDEGGRSLLKPVGWNEYVDGSYPDLTSFRLPNS
jgi:hypothetical protein